MDSLPLNLGGVTLVRLELYTPLPFPVYELVEVILESMTLLEGFHIPVSHAVVSSLVRPLAGYGLPPPGGIL